jgi:hypothetical protein
MTRLDARGRLVERDRDHADQHGRQHERAEHDDRAEIERRAPAEPEVARECVVGACYFALDRVVESVAIASVPSPEREREGWAPSRSAQRLRREVALGRVARRERRAAP